MELNLYNIWNPAVVAGFGQYPGAASGRRLDYKHDLDSSDSETGASKRVLLCIWHDVERFALCSCLN